MIKQKSFSIIVVVILIFALNACTSQTDVTFFDNNTWQLDTSFHYFGRLDQVVNQVADLFMLNQFLTSLNIEIDWSSLLAGTNQNNFSIERETFERIFSLLKAHYGTKQINFTGRLVDSSPAKGTTYKIKAMGNSWQSFTELAPGFITIAETAPRQVHIQIYFGQENVLLAALIEETFTFHGKEIVYANAPIVKNNSAEWYNPDIIDVELVPVSVTSRKIASFIPYAVAGVLCICLLILAVFLIRRWRYS